MNNDLQKYRRFDRVIYYKPEFDYYKESFELAPASAGDYNLSRAKGFSQSKRFSAKANYLYLITSS